MQEYAYAAIVHTIGAITDAESGHTIDGLPIITGVTMKIRDAVGIRRYRNDKKFHTRLF